MTNDEQHEPLPVDADPFEGLISRGRSLKLNPALEAEAPPVMPRVGPDEPPAPDPRMVGYVSRDDVPVGVNIRAPKRVRDAAKRAALTRGVTMADYLIMLIKRDTGLD